MKNGLFMVKGNKKNMKAHDGDLLNGMLMHLNYDCHVFGANGHYSVGSYYDKYEGYQDIEEEAPAKDYKESVSEELQKALWLFYF